MMAVASDGSGAHEAPTSGRFAFLPFENSMMLFHEQRQELYVLNDLAFLIFEGLDRHDDRETIVCRLAEDFEIEIEPARGFVLEISAFREMLLHPSAAPRRASRYPPAGLPTTRLPTGATAVRSYQLLGSRFSFYCARDEDDERVHALLAHLESREAPTTGARLFEIEVVEKGGGAVVATGELHFDDCPVGVDPVTVVATRVQLTAVRCASYLVDVHAGAVSNGNHCLLLPACSGSGKSTLTAALVASGLFYLSDETAPLDDASLDAWPVPQSVCVKDGSVTALTPYFPELRNSPSYVRVDGKSVRYLTPPPKSLAYDITRPVPVKWIVFPNYHTAGDGRLVALTKAAALQRLLAECSSLPRRLTLPRVRRLIRWIAQIECYELSFAALPTAIEQIIGLTGLPEPPGSRLDATEERH